MCMSAKDDADDILKKTLTNYEEGIGPYTVTYIDPTVNPNFAAQYTDQSVSANSLFVVSGDRSTVISYDDIYEYGTDSSGYYSTVTGYDGGRGRLPAPCSM